MEILIKAAAIAVTGAVLVLTIKKNSPDIALLLTVAVGCIVIYIAADLLVEIIDFICELSDMAEVSSAAFSIVLKTIGIAIITKIASDVCSDAGQSSVSSAVEITGAAAALYVSIPLMKTVFSMINSYI